jgi:hypothetical protein
LLSLKLCSIRPRRQYQATARPASPRLVAMLPRGRPHGSFGAVRRRSACRLATR